jgi:T5SS/PEP-CTERM-associated repeat protein
MKRHPFSISLLALCAFVLPHETCAQFTGNNQTNIISGVASNWPSDYYVGSNYVFDALLIKNGGMLAVTNGTGYIGYNIGASNNSAVVSGSGSLWTNSGFVYVGYSGAGSSLIISNGGAVVTPNNILVGETGGSNSSLIVTGGGSLRCASLATGDSSGDHLVFTNGGYAFCTSSITVGGGNFAQFNCDMQVADTNSVLTCVGLTVGVKGGNNRLVISNGGSVFNSGGGNVGLLASANSNSILVTDLGSVLSNGTSIAIGPSGSANSLVVSNSGVVSDGGADLGENPGSSNNVAIVTGNGSVWNNSGSMVVGSYGTADKLEIRDGGAVVCSGGILGQHSPILNNGYGSNSVLVTGVGSVWNIGGGFLTLGGPGNSGNSLVISNSGLVINGHGQLGSGGGSNSVLVTGNGSVWNNQLDLSVGLSGTNHTLTISAGGLVVAGNAFVGLGSFGNLLHVLGGSLIVTNSSGDGRLDVRQGTLVFDSGTITAERVLLTNSTTSVIEFHSGLLNSKNTAVTNTQQFIVGDGVGIGNLHLLGGTHSFNDGLRIRANSLLTGCGTVNGSVLVDAGAVVRSDCTNLVFTGNVTNNGTMLADGAVLESSGTLVNNGTIYLFNGGTTNFHGTFINNGAIVTVGPPTISSISRMGNDMMIQVPSVPTLTYQLQSSRALPSGWSDSGAPQTGTGSVLTFTDPGAATNASSLFYRVRAY